MVILFLTVGILLILVFLSWQVPEPGLMRRAYNAAPLPDADLESVPSEIREDAEATAGQLHRRNRAKKNRLLRDMLATYQALRHSDILILFNSGGYGWTALDKASGYATIVSAIEDELVARRCRVMVLNYQRAYRSIRGYVSEILNAGAKSIAKPAELATRLRFLWRHLPGLRILMAAESNGTVMSNQVIRLLPDEARLFSIELGPPFWYQSFMNERVINLRSNGTTPDAFSYGQWRRAFKANWDAIRGRHPSAPGNVLLYIGAPGHDYNWDNYPLIRDTIRDFIKKHFSRC